MFIFKFYFISFFIFDIWFYKILGRAIRTHTNVKPIFASVGNYIDIDTVTKLALQLTDKESHIPIPTRYADLDTHQRRAELLTAKF